MKRSSEFGPSTKSNNWLLDWLQTAARALAEAGLDQSKAAAKYIRLRVQSFKDEQVLLQERAVFEADKIEKAEQAAIDSEAPIHPRMRRISFPGHGRRPR